MLVVGRWKAIGRGFRIDSGHLDQIQTDNQSDCEECLSGVLTYWLRKNYDVELFGEPTWKTVVKVVAHSAAGNNCALALSIAGRHSGNRLLCQTIPCKCVFGIEVQKCLLNLLYYFLCITGF